MPRTFKARTTDITNLGSEVKDVKIPTNDCNRKVPRFHFREVVFILLFVYQLHKGEKAIIVTCFLKFLCQVQKLLYLIT